MTPWRALADELDRWAESGRSATFWWRDDDAIEPTPALERLLDLREDNAVPLALAVIPAKARPSLTAVKAGVTEVAVLQHGYAHANHCPDTRRKSEFGADRQVQSAARDLMAGRSSLVAIFGESEPSILVPPWNRIDARLIALLPGLGYTGLSTFAARNSREAAPGVIQTNTHVDIIDWPGTRRFVGEEAAIGAAVAHLAARRAGAADPDEATGLLTHHLAHDAECWTFVAGFLAATTAHGGARWISAGEAFAS
jgi:hypothetical protein